MASPVFDKEQWPIRRMDGSATFAHMTNEVELPNDETVFVVIPTELFKYTRDMMPHEDPADLRLFLDSLQGDTYMFGITGRYAYHDLWIYKGTPKWAYGD